MTEIVIALFLLVGGCILTSRLHFFNPNVLIRASLRPFRRKRHAKEGLPPFSALCTALGGCVGTGNVIGVTLCIMTGGAGSVFWIWVCGALSVATKYTEIYLASKSSSEGGSPLHYCTKYLGKSGRALGVAWCVLCAVCALCSGAGVQANAISDAVTALVSDDMDLIRVRLICGCVLFLITFLIITGGLRRVSLVSSLLVPVACAAYTAVCICCIISSGVKITSVLSGIVKDAFSPLSAISGGTTYAFLRTMRLGVSRGIFSNEAGMGTSPLSLSFTSCEPAEQAGIGIWEIVIDTFVICTATALCILSCVPSISEFSSPAQAVICAFTRCMDHTVGRIFLSCVIILFAYTSVIGWAHYGTYCFNLLTEKRGKYVIIYRLLFCLMLITGSIFPLGIIWEIASTSNMVLAVPNVFAILLITQKKEP